jgi:hypothetical protein
MVTEQGVGGGSTNSTLSEVSPIYDIVWGMYCVPAPTRLHTRAGREGEHEDGGEVEEVFFCRSLVKSREFPLQAYSSEYLPNTAQSEAIADPLLHHHSHLSFVMNKEHLDLARAIHLIAESLPSSANSSMQSIFLKEFTMGELVTLPAQLRAETLRIHTIKDKLTNTWCADHPPAVVTGADETTGVGAGVDERRSDRPSVRDSQDSHSYPRHSRTESKSFSRPRSRATSRTSRHSQTSLIGRLTSTVLSIFDGEGGLRKGFQPLPDDVKLDSPCGFGILWEGKALQKVSSSHSLPSLPPHSLQGSLYYHESSTSGHYASLGLHGAIGVFSRTLAYQDLLSSFALRDMLSTDHGVHLPILVHSVSVSCLTLTHSLTPEPRQHFRRSRPSSSTLDHGRIPH